jgi:hypothetical protein
MNRAPIFVTAGLDIREWPATNFVSADATAWAQDEDLYGRAQSEFRFSENPLQLLHADLNADVNALIGVLSSPGSPGALVALELTELALRAYPQTIPPISLPDHLHWELLGFDICDINGFFSFLHMGVFQTKALPLFHEDQLLDAFALSEVANIVVPAHRPFVVVRLKRLIVIGDRP